MELFTEICAGAIMMILTGIIIGISYDFARGNDNADK